MIKVSTFEDLIKPDLRSLSTNPKWLEEQLKKVPISLKVPKIIKELIELALNVARYGYFRYEFYRLALFLLILSFEGALREKYNKSDKSLQKLINRAKKERIIPKEFFPDFKLKAIQNLRNINAHPIYRSICPPSARGYQRIVYLINCIFDENDRKNPPSIFEKEIGQRKKYKAMQDAVKRIDTSKLKPGDTIVTVEMDELVSKGIYVCLKCGNRFTIHNREQKLIPCSECDGLDFRFISVDD